MKIRVLPKRVPAIVCAAVFLLSPLALAKFASPELVPTQRMLQNTEAFLDENPSDAQAHYTKGRIFYLSFRNRSLWVQGWETAEKGKLPRVAPNWMLWSKFIDQVRTARARELASAEGGDKYSEAWNRAFEKRHAQLIQENWQPPALSPAASLDLAVESLASFDEAIRLEPKNGVFHLGKASLLEQVRDYLDELAKSPSSVEFEVPESFRALDDEVLLVEYLRAHLASIEENLKLETQPISGIRSLVGHESGTAIVRLAGRSPAAVAKIDGLDVSRVEKNLKKLEKIRMGAITPILISLQAGASTHSMVSHGHRANFDVDGDGRREWLESWPSPTVGILVWDRYGNGEIRSGVQWFGSFGFHMIWRDGYAALDAFDDSRDGWLEGEELRDLKLWFDADGDAVSDPGEVRGLSACGVEAIAVEASSEIGGSPANLRGVRLSDGTLTPSFDWIVEVESSVAER